MEAFGNVYAQVGAVGFLLIIVGVASWRLGEIAKLLAMKKLNGRLGATPSAWPPSREREWERVVTQVNEMHAQDKDIKTGIDQGSFTCQWNPDKIGDLKQALSDLCTEVKLLRLEVELTRKNGG